MKNSDNDDLTHSLQTGRQGWFRQRQMSEAKWYYFEPSEENQQLKTLEPSIFLVLMVFISFRQDIKHHRLFNKKQQIETLFKHIRVTDRYSQLSADLFFDVFVLTLVGTHMPKKNLTKLFIKDRIQRRLKVGSLKIHASICRITKAFI